MTELRPLTKPDIQFPDTKTAGKPPRLDFLPLSRLRIDDSYQRRIERRGLATIARICAEFDWNRFAPLIVARVPGKEELYAIIDGQHRATAALLRDFEKVPCAIVDATALEHPAIFTAINGNVTPITIFQLFKTGRAAKAEWALDIDRACEIAGIKPLLYPKAQREIKPFETMAIGTLRRLIARFGVDDVAAALKFATKQPGASEPGFWSSRAIDHSIAEWHISQNKQQEIGDNGVSIGQRIRDLRKKGYSRFAIQAALGVKLADIEEAIGGAA